MKTTHSVTSCSVLSCGSFCGLILIGVSTLAATVSADEEHQHSRNTLPRTQLKDSDAPFLKPAEAVAKMAIPDGFEVSVFASEPDIAEPIAFCFDDRGRIWVAENFNYQTRRQHTDDHVSRIQILEDTDGDGVFDKKRRLPTTLLLRQVWPVGSAVSLSAHHQT